MSFSQLGCAKPATPASFETSNLLIIPAVVSPGEEVMISVSVSNTGEEAGEYSVALKINDVVEDSQMVAIDGGGGQKVRFTVSEVEEGEYTVSVDSLSGKFTVAAAEEAAEGEQPAAPAEPQTYTVTWTDNEFDDFARQIIGKPMFDYKMHFLSGNKLSIQSLMSFIFVVDLCDGKLCFKNVDKKAWDNVFKKGDPYLIFDNGTMTLMDLPEGLAETMAPGLNELPVLESVETGDGEISFTFTM
jgi:hypothetical protein